MSAQDITPNSNKPSPGEGSRQDNFKEQLDRAAEETRIREQEQAKPKPLVEKITEYIPVAAKVLGGGQHNEPQDPEPKPPSGPPSRPHHDDKIEDFVRDQHRSKGGDGDSRD